MRTMHSAHERTHIGSCAGTSDEYKVPFYCFPIQELRGEEIAWPLSNRVCGEYCDVHPRKQAYRAGIVVIHGDANRPSACDSGKGFCNAYIASSQFLLGSAGNYAG